jgi:LPS-assembly protein
MALLLIAAVPALAQFGRPPSLPPTTPLNPVLNPDLRIRVPRPNAPPTHEWAIRADRQESNGPQYYLRGKAEIEGTEMLLQADEIDYNDDTGYAEARGNVHYQQFERGEELRADKVEYNTKEETGKFYNVRGWSRTRVDTRPRMLTSDTPLYFQGEWAERLQDKYILHNGMVTNCKLPNPWWTLRGPKFDIIPDSRAIAYRSVFRLRRLPLFFTPFFYKALGKEPRRSGFLTPNIGNSSTRGKMVGLGYYWAFNRSYDVTYRAQYFSERGLAHHIDFRGKPHESADFDAIFYGVQDRGELQPDGSRIKEGGYNIFMTGRADLGDGFQARGTLNYLSSLLFRQSFTESFNEAIYSESNSQGLITKHWSSYTFNTEFARLENFQSTTPGDSIIIRKLPELEFSSRDHQFTFLNFPFWFSFDSTGGALRRTQPLFQTRQFVDREDIAPRIMTALRWKGFSLLPGFAIRETHWGDSQANGVVTGKDFNRFTREFTAELIAPTLERTFNQKTWLGEKLKHVIEPRASFRYVGGVTDFDAPVRFDETELLSNTTEAEFSLTNRLYAKHGDDVTEVLSWEVLQRRFFDPTFGGAVVPDQRNVVLSSLDLTPFAFLDGPRNYSPVVSILRTSPRPGIGIEWRTDYDPLRKQIVDSSITADARYKKYFVILGHNQVRSDPVLAPNANQFRGSAGFGDPNHRGWNAAVNAVYDYRLGVLQFATTQVTYNTDCCGFSVQYRRFNFGTRNENQFRLSFVVANIGSFGTLKKQERLF